MPTMNIKDPEVHRMAHELARRRGTSATGAVRDALREALERERCRRAGLADRLIEIGAAYRARGGRPVTDEEMYDERGLPR
jgi:antitoxin VapB